MIRGNNLKGKNHKQTMSNIGKVFAKNITDSKMLFICDISDLESLIHYSVIKYAGINSKDAKNFADDEKTLKRVLDAEKEIWNRYNMKTLFLYGEKDNDSETPNRLYNDLFIKTDKESLMEYDILVVKKDILENLTKSDKYDKILSQVKKIYIY